MVPFRSVLLLASVVACSTADRTGEEVVSSSKAPILISGNQVNQVTPAVLTNLEVAATSSVVGVRSACIDPTGGQPGNAAVVAFEMHNVTSEDMKSVWSSSYCGGFAGSAAAGSANATQITRGLVGFPSASPAWTAPDVLYRGQPQLVALGPRDWVALVVLVSGVNGSGNAPAYGTNVAVLLSTNGGASWGDPQLVSVPGTSGAAGANFDKVRWMAATASQNNATVAGTALNAKSVTVTWRFEGTTPTTYTRTVGWRSAGGANGGFNRNPVRTVPSTLAVREPSIVAGRTTADFLFLEWPDKANDASQTGAQCFSGVPQVVTQSWKGAMSIDDGVNWVAFPVAATEAKWPTCVGGDGSSTAYWRNSARPGLAYDTTNKIVNYAVTRVRANGEVSISVEGYPLLNVVHPATDAGAATIVPSNPTVSFTTPRFDQPASIRQDQWMPALAADAVGNVHMSWYDTARSVAEPDASKGWPSGLWGFSWVQNSAPPAVATRLISAPNGYLFNNPNYLPIFYNGRPFLGDYHGSANIIGNGTFVESATDAYANGTYLSAAGAPFGMFTTVDF